MVFDFEDLSFSGIVSIVDGDIDVAKELLIQTYKKIQIENEILFEKRQEAFLKEIEVNRLNASIDYILTSAKLVKPLLIITKDNEVISITEDGLSSHKNVL